MTAFYGVHVSRETYGVGVLQPRNQNGPLGPCVQLVCLARSCSMKVGARQCGMKRRSGRTRNLEFSKGVTGFAPRGFDPRPSNLCGIVSKELLSRRLAFLWVRWKQRALEKCAKYCSSREDARAAYGYRIPRRSRDDGSISTRSNRSENDCRVLYALSYAA